MKYSDICEAKSQREMLQKFDKLMSDMMTTHPDVDPAILRATQLANIGYMAGYYNYRTFENVVKWLRTSHPAFGKIYPTPEEAFKKGKTAGKG